MSQSSLAASLIRQFWTLARFSVVGGGATVLHFLVASLLVVGWDLSPFLANAGGFATALFFSFLGQHFWTFRSPHRVRVTFGRFAIVSLTAFLASNFVLAGLVQWHALSPLAATLLAASAIPLISFVLFRWWVFRS